VGNGTGDWVLGTGYWGLGEKFYLVSPALSLAFYQFVSLTPGIFVEINI
jgi:hypothetical protein